MPTTLEEQQAEGRLASACLVRRDAWKAAGLGRAGVLASFLEAGAGAGGSCQVPSGGCGTSRVKLGSEELPELPLPGPLSTAVWVLHGQEPSRSNTELWQGVLCIRAWGFAAKSSSAEDLTGQCWSGRGFWTLVLSTVRIWTHPQISPLYRTSEACDFLE